MDDRGHLGLSPQCGICADTILKHERVVAIFSDHDSASYSCTRPFPFPQPGHATTNVDGFLQCRYPYCEKCATSPEFAPIHYDCYTIFINRCTVKGPDALHRLWVLAAWRYPWRGAQLLHLPTGVDVDTFITTAELGGFPEIRRLPNEVLHMIQDDNSSSSLFWRYALAVRLAAHVSKTDPQPPRTIPLNDIVVWERNERLELAESTSMPIAMRITIDSGGISKVERLSYIPEYAGGHSDASSFIVESASVLSEVAAQLQDGLLRLQIPPGQRPLSIWNTPSPPKLSSCEVYVSDLCSWECLLAVETDKIRGITFFYYKGQLIGIHIHHSEEASALSTCERFSNRLQRDMAWIYLPLPEGDRLAGLGLNSMTRQNFNVLARMEKAGDFSLGPYVNENVRNTFLSKTAPVTLIYDQPREGLGVAVFGAYGKLQGGYAGFPGPFLLDDHDPDPLGSGSYFSSAPLDDVSSAVVFYDQSTDFCRGILFHYKNGGSRAIGECRLHVDLAEEVVEPAKLCFRAETQTLRRAQVKFERDPQYESSDAEWKCYPLAGVVKCWFTSESCVMVVETEL